MTSQKMTSFFLVGRRQTLPSFLSMVVIAFLRKRPLDKHFLHYFHIAEPSRHDKGIEVNKLEAWRGSLVCIYCQGLIDFIAFSGQGELHHG